MSNHTTRTGVAALAGLAAAALLSTSLAAPAGADSIGVKDPADVGHGVDLRAVQVDNGAKHLRIVLHHTNLRPGFRTGSSGSAYIDTDASDPGPELVFTGGYYQGSDYQLLETEGFGVKQWGDPVSGSYRLRPDYAKDQVRMRLSQKIVGDTDRVRVSVKVAGYRTDGSTVTDWLGQPFGWTEWVERG